LQEFGTIRRPFQDFRTIHREATRLDHHVEQEETMSVLEALKGQADPVIDSRKGRVMRGAAGYRAEQGSDYEPGVSAETTGSKSIWLGMISLPPGGRTRAHVHEHHETAMYMLSGNEMELWTGDQLQYREVVRPGDYIFIPANVLHVAVNRCAKPAVFIGSRNEATAQESVVLRPEMDARVP
jgi:uncharacterized RmlC-like cupin family protein